MPPIRKLTDTHLIVNQGSQGQVIKQISKEAPDVGIAIFSEALVVESVDLGDLSGLVVSTEDGDAVAVSELHCDKERDGFYRVITTVNVVTHKQIVGVW